MLNEWQEFLDYTGPMTYKADGKKDTAWLGRFTFEAPREFGGLSRILTIWPGAFCSTARTGQCWTASPDSGSTMLAGGCAPGAVCRSGQVQSRSGSIGRTSDHSTQSSLHWWMRMAGAGSADISTPPWLLCGTPPR